MLCKWNHIVGSLLGLGSFSLRIIPWTFDTYTAIFSLHISIACRISLFLKNTYFIYGCAGSSLPCRLFSRGGQQGLLSIRSVEASYCAGFSCRRAQARGHAWVQQCDPQAPGHRLSSSSTGLTCSADVASSQTRGRILSPALAGRFFTTEPSGKPRNPLFFKTEKSHPVLGTDVSELYATRVLLLASYHSNSPHFSLCGPPLSLSQPSQSQFKNNKQTNSGSKERRQ